MIDTAIKRSFDERFKIVRQLKKKDLVDPGEALSRTLMDAGKGAFFTFEGHTYFIKDKARYEEASENFENRLDYFVTELTCLDLDTGNLVYIEWEYDDELEIALTLERTSFRHLTDDRGEAVDQDDLDQIAQDKDVILFKGEKFWYEDDWAAFFQRAGKEERVFLYEFENEAGSRFLTIEEWQGSGKEEYRIYTSKPVEPGKFALITKGA